MTPLNDVALLKAQANAHAARLFATIATLADECAQAIKLAEQINALHDRLASQAVDTLTTEIDRQVG